jgi:hypothetical protein
MLPAKFGSIWPNFFRGEDIFNISQSEKRINLGSHVCWPNGKNEEALQRILHKCFLPSLAPFYQAVSEEKIFLNSLCTVLY